MAFDIPLLQATRHRTVAATRPKLRLAWRLLVAHPYRLQSPTRSIMSSQSPQVAQAAQAANTIANAPSSSRGVPEDVASYVNNSTDPTDKRLVIRRVTPEIVTFSLPFTRGGFLPIGGRTTAVQLQSLDIFVYVSHPPTPATKAVLAKMGGEVKYLVTPDGEHDMNIEAFHKAYPQAKAIGVERLEQRKPGVQWSYIYKPGQEPPQFGFEPEISLHQVSSHVNDELVAIHHPSRTLIEADMLFNLPPKEQYSRVGGLPLLSKLLPTSSMSPGGKAHGAAVSSILKDKGYLKAEMQSIKSVDFDRIIPCHGDVIETGGKVAWEKLFAKFSQ